MLVWRSCFNYDVGLAKADLLVGCDDVCVIGLTLTARVENEGISVAFLRILDHLTPFESTLDYVLSNILCKSSS